MVSILFILKKNGAEFSSPLNSQNLLLELE